MEIKSDEFFINMKSLPKRGTSAFNELVDWETEKCLGGVKIQGVHIPPWLYWHINHWNIRIDAEDKFGNIVRKKANPTLRDNEWVRAEALEKCRVEKKGYIEVGARQGGKDLLNSSLLYKEDEEITIGDCKIGDKIYDESGKLTTITGKYPQGIKPVYKITLLDGRELFCGLDHNWFIKDRFAKNKTFVKTTRELLENFKTKRDSWSHRKNSFEFRYSIPNNQPVQYSEKKQIIDPYFLGLWLGDGSNYYSKITSVDKEIIDYIYKYAESIGLQVTIDDKDTFMITSGEKGGRQNTKNIVHSFLKNKNLYQNKHIPFEYLYGSEEQRMELLRGLMDSDGSCDTTGSIEFSSSIPRLADDFYKLCRSLGIILSNKTRQTFYKKNNVKVKCKVNNRFTLFTDKQVFKLSRKLEKIRCKPKYKNWVAICNIEYIGDFETTCITVDNDSHLFLTDNYTPTHNSEAEASYIGQNATMFEQSQNVVVGSNEGDLLLLTDKLDFGLKNIWEGLNRGLIDKDWSKKQVRLGYKDTANEDHVWSYIVIRNTNSGTKTEVAAGTTAKAFVFDEIGKAKFSQAIEAAKPAFLSEFGWRVVPILVGTGGSFENAEDAKRYFFNPDGNNFLSFEQPDGRLTGLFLSGEYRQDFKYTTNLREFLNKEKNLNLPKGELDNILIKVSDKEKARETILLERVEKSKDPDPKELLKQIMYFPLTVDECFLTDSNNNFPVESIKPHLEYLKNNYEHNIVDIFRDVNNNVKTKSSSGYIVTEFPAKPTTLKDAGVVIYEPFIEGLPDFTYIAGIDCINENESSDKVNSLGVIYIYKRMHDPTKPFQNSIVASYAGRPKSTRDFQQLCLDLIEYYNAIALPEAENKAFIEWFYHKKREHLLIDGLPIAREINPRTLTRAEKGLKATSPNQRFYMNLMVEYTKEPIDSHTDGEVLGFHRIPDYMLLEEMVNYKSRESSSKGVHDGNYDRICAFGHCLVLARILDRDASLIELPQLEQKEAGFNFSRKMNSFVRPYPKTNPLTGEKIKQKPSAPFNPFI